MGKPGLFDHEITKQGLFDPEVNKGGLFDPTFIVPASAAVAASDVFFGHLHTIEQGMRAATAVSLGGVLNE